MYKDIIERRTVRKYAKSTVSDTILEQVLKAGMYAPFASKEMPFHFLVVKNKETLKDLQKLHPFGKPLETAPIAILVCAKNNDEAVEGLYVSDCAAATQNLLLAAKSFNLGSCWLGLYPWNEFQEKFTDYFSLPQNVKPFSLITIGYPDEEEKPKPDRFDKEKIHYETWD